MDKNEYMSDSLINRSDPLDEDIMPLRKEQQKQKYSDIRTGVYIKGVLIEFQEAIVLDQRFKILLPTYFTDMSLELAKMKYPSEQRPQCIKTSPDTATNIGMSLMDIPISESNLEQEAIDMKLVLKKINPAMQFYNTGLEELVGFKLAWFDFKSFGIDGDMYNIMFTAAVEGKMLHGVFNCAFEEYKDWKDPALQMIKSISIIDELD